MVASVAPFSLLFFYPWFSSGYSLNVRGVFIYSGMTNITRFGIWVLVALSVYPGVYPGMINVQRLSLGCIFDRSFTPVA